MPRPRLIRGAISAILPLADSLIAAGSFLFSFRLRMLNHVPSVDEVIGLLGAGELLSTLKWETFQPYLHLFLVAVPLHLFWLSRNRFYLLRGEFSLLDDFVGLIKATTMATLWLIVIAFMYRGVFAFREYSYSRGIFLLHAVFTFTGYMVLRLGLRWAQTMLRRRGRNLIPALIVGEGDLAELCLKEMTSKPHLGYRVVGVVTSPGATRSSPTRSSKYSLLGDLNDLPEIVRRWGIEEVFITDSTINPDVLFETIMKCWRWQRVSFRVVPHLLNCLPSKTALDHIGSLPMVQLFQEPLRGPARHLKRAFDLVASALGLIVLSPLLAIIAAIVKLTSPGPILFRQERVGMDGRIFLAYKFRTMYPDADDRPHREVAIRLIKGVGSPPSPGMSLTPTMTVTQNVLYGKVPGDRRITPVGRWLRRWSLDELPQLINVLKGEMSLVGPRPPIPYEVELYSPWHRKRLDVKPGLTGLWQVSGRNRLPFERMVELDLYYIENWSFWLDLLILLKTIPAILRGDTE
ncbi:MAG TPA: sugar transferase [Blastocatellia bacterium]|nr:sugar transferase [Blastocatellia bacterium]